MRGTLTQGRFWQGWGVHIEIAGPPESLERLEEVVPPCGRFHRQSSGSEIRFEWDPVRGVWVRYPSLESFLDLENALALEVATHSPGYLFVHAGAVRYQGRVLVIPGVSRAGKSTLVEALARRGACYYSDEFAVFHPDGKVSPYPRKLCLKANSQRPKTVLLAPESLGWSEEMEAAPLGWLVDCRYSKRQALQPISPGEGLLALFANAVAARTRARALFQSLSRALVGVPALRGVRDEADLTADWLMDWLSA